MYESTRGKEEDFVQRYYRIAMSNANKEQCFQLAIYTKTAK